MVAHDHTLLFPSISQDIRNGSYIRTSLSLLLFTAAQAHCCWHWTTYLGFTAARPLASKYIGTRFVPGFCITQINYQPKQLRKNCKRVQHYSSAFCVDLIQVCRRGDLLQVTFHHLVPNPPDSTSYHFCRLRLRDEMRSTSGTKTC